MNQSKTNKQQENEIEEIEVEITKLDLGETFDIVASPLQQDVDRIVVANTVDTGRALKQSQKGKATKAQGVEVAD